MADFWGIDKAVPGFNDNQGISLVLVNTQIGKELLSEAANQPEIKEVAVQQGMQASLIKPFQMPPTRKAFWTAFQEKEFSYVIIRYTWKPRLWEWKKRFVRGFIRGKSHKGV